MTAKQIAMTIWERAKHSTLLRNRYFQLASALALCVLILCAYIGKFHDAKHTIAELSSQLKTSSDENANLEKEISYLRTQNALLANAQPQQPEVTALNPVESLYNPESTNSTQQAAMDSLKKRYEETLVTYFFLKKCNRVNTIDFHIIISALSQEMASINAPGRLQHDIVTAAQGSYQEMYAKTACSAATIETLSTQYSNYIASLSNSYMLK